MIWLPHYLGFGNVASLTSLVQSQAGSEIRLAKMGRNRLDRVCRRGRHAAADTITKTVVLTVKAG